MLLRTKEVAWLALNKRFCLTDFKDSMEKYLMVKVVPTTLTMMVAVELTSVMLSWLQLAKTEASTENTSRIGWLVPLRVI